MLYPLKVAVCFWNRVFHILFLKQIWNKWKNRSLRRKATLAGILYCSSLFIYLFISQHLATVKYKQLLKDFFFNHPSRSKFPEGSCTESSDVTLNSFIWRYVYPQSNSRNFRKRKFCNKTAGVLEIKPVFKSHILLRIYNF